MKNKSNDGIVESIVSQKWKVVDRDYVITRDGYTDTPEGLSIFTENDDEVIGCSEWMRAEVEVFEYICEMHNKSIEQ